MPTCWGCRARMVLVLDVVVGRHVLVECSLGMDCPEAPCGGDAKCCRVVDPDGGCQNIGDCRNIGNLNYDGIHVSVGSCNPDSSAGDLGDRGRVVLSVVPIWIFPGAACHIKGVRRVVVWPVVFPWPWCFSRWWGWLDKVGSRLDLVNCSCGCAVQHVVFTLLHRMDP